MNINVIDTNNQGRSYPFEKATTNKNIINYEPDFTVLNEETMHSHYVLANQNYMYSSPKMATDTF